MSILLLEGFDPYTTPFLPASHKWTTAIGVAIAVDEGRSGFPGDNAAFFDTSLASVLETPITPTAVDGIYTVTFGHAFRFVTLSSSVVVASVLTAISRFDLVVTSLGSVSVRQTTGGVLLGTICQSDDGIVPIGSGGCYIEVQVIGDLANAAAVTVRVSDQFGQMNPICDGPLFAWLAGEAFTTLREGALFDQLPATWFLDDVYVTDGVQVLPPVALPDRLVYNDSFLGNTHIQTFYATADGANLTIGNTPWMPNIGATAFNLINEHPPDEDVTYIESTVANQLTTCLFASPEASPFGKIGCFAFAAIFGIQWDGRLRNPNGLSNIVTVDGSQIVTADLSPLVTEGGAAAFVAPILRRLVTGILASDIVEAGTPIEVNNASYRYYLQVFDRDPTTDQPFSFAAFLPAGVGIPNTLEFGVESL